MFTFSYFIVNHGHCHHVGREWKARSFKKSYDIAIRNFKACTLHVCISFHPNEILSQSSSNYWNHSLQLIYFQISYHHCLFPTTFHVNISYPKTCWWLEKKKLCIYYYWTHQSIRLYMIWKVELPKFQKKPLFVAKWVEV